jgi:hypothetical protein
MFWVWIEYISAFFFKLVLLLTPIVFKIEAKLLIHTLIFVLVLEERLILWSYTFYCQSVSVLWSVACGRSVSYILRSEDLEVAYFIGLEISWNEHSVRHYLNSIILQIRLFDDVILGVYKLELIFRPGLHSEPSCW